MRLSERISEGLMFLSVSMRYCIAVDAKVAVAISKMNMVSTETGKPKLHEIMEIK